MIDSLAGRSFGPYPLRVCAEKVADFVEATGDDNDRWLEYAPPSWAAACLFAVAPKLLNEPEIAGRGVLHGDQRFRWHGPIRIESTLQVSGVVPRVRSRGGVDFVVFDFFAIGEEGPVLDGTSTFLVSGEAPAAGESVEEIEPDPDERGANDPLPSPGQAVSVRRSASRSDLIRYAAATRDWNSVHWDHASARSVGLSGIVVHGLLQASWILSVVSSLRPGPVALGSFRFRAPLRPGVGCRVEGSRDADMFTARITSDSSELVTGQVRWH